MIEYYAQIRAAHILAVILSGTLFAVRGAGVLAGARWPMHPVIRYSSYTIDTTLLTAALMLVAVLPAGLFANHWLTVKLVLVVAYIVLGVFALRRARTPRGRWISYVVALAIFIMIVGIARTHTPSGWLSYLGRSS
jgi:uncharacterized membrane protein SirB2